jgi:hypothetical protein
LFQAKIGIAFGFIRILALVNPAMACSVLLREISQVKENDSIELNLRVETALEDGDIKDEDISNKGYQKIHPTDRRQ